MHISNGTLPNDTRNNRRCTDVIQRASQGSPYHYAEYLRARAQTVRFETGKDAAEKLRNYPQVVLGGINSEGVKHTPVSGGRRETDAYILRSQYKDIVDECGLVPMFHGYRGRIVLHIVDAHCRPFGPNDIEVSYIVANLDLIEDDCGRSYRAGLMLLGEPDPEEEPFADHTAGLEEEGYF